MEYIILFFLAFFAGVLTVLAPCVLPLLPVIVGGSLADKNPWRPIIITGSLALSIVVFTLLLKFATLFVDIPSSFWKYFSASIVLFFGTILLFPYFWEIVETKLSFGAVSGTLLSQAGKKGGIWGMVLVGAALGPVFSSCSPTYFFVLATILPQSFFVGLLGLLFYALGLAVVMGSVAILGQRFIAGARWASDPRGWFRRLLGVLFLLVGFAIATGLDKKVESRVLDTDPFQKIQTTEQGLVDKVQALWDPANEEN